MTDKLSSKTIDNIIKHGNEEQRKRLFEKHYDSLNASHLISLYHHSKDPLDFIKKY